MENQIWFLLLSCLTFVYGQEAEFEKRRDAKQFSLFSIVTFKNEECSAQSTAGLKGVCMTSSECNSNGYADGNCAAAFGVCCIQRVSSCGGTVENNCTYIDNPSYPSTYTSTSSCSYTVKRCQDDICQIRLDFFKTILMQPQSSGSNFGICSDTVLAITGGTSSASVISNPPSLCGILTDQHVYIDSGRAATAATVAFSFGATGSGTANVWRIKVSQIPCWSETKAPNGCLQYFYGKIRHTVESFGWDGTKTYSTGGSLANMFYTTCFRPEKGMCGMTYSATPVSSSLDPFELKNEGADEMSDFGEECDSFITIHSSWPVAAEDKYCGGYFGQDDEETTLEGAVQAMTSNPWTIATAIEEDVEAAYAGYSIDAQQTACISSFGGDQVNAAA